MNDGQFDGLSNRVTAVEEQMKNVQEDVRELRREDIKDIKSELRLLHDEFTAGQRGMTRTEKMMFSGIVITAITAIGGFVALLTQGPGT